MFRVRILFARYAAFLVLYLSLLNCNAKKNNHHCDNPSSCGSIHNISFPFRLESDPVSCGDSNYELACDNNDTLVLSLYSGKYYVQAIHYHNHTIRVVDAGVRKDNCSSTPLYYLIFQSHFSYKYPSPFYLSSYYTIIFLNCENPVRHPLYFDTAPCINGSVSSSSNSSAMSAMKRHSYVLLGNPKASDVADLCSIDSMLPTSIYFDPEKSTNVSYSDIHNWLAYGFELSWPSGFYRCGVLCWFLGVLSYSTIALVLCTAAKVVCGTPCVLAFLIYKWRRRHLSMFDTVEDFLRSRNNLMPVRYSFSHIRKMTKGFKEKLGEGGYGCVYKGKLRSGHAVAVKVLGTSKANGQEFINEVATIGRIHHVNVVKLIGFCAERSKRALVYDFMPNGSLDKYIFSHSEQGNVLLSCEKMYDISLGVARGIEYLHRGCDMQILHFDIKPHNILLDENFIPKVSDFGLAKLYPTDDSIVSLTAARGTMGYMAPELFYKNIGGVSYKADVYSFGMLLMEMVGRRKNLNAFAEHSSQIYFPSWVYDQFSEGKDMEMAQMGGTTEEESKITKKMIIVALWCIQLKPSDRPSMKQVVQMLEGSVQLLQRPPKPLLSPQEMTV